MAEIGQSGPEEFGAARRDAAPGVASTRDSLASPQKYCVYNQTRERFVATDVEGAHGSPDAAAARLRAMEQGVGTGLWILPYQEISPTSIRFPLDLVFLNNDCAVLAIVESFPLAGVPASGANALSVLAFPADALAKGEMRDGDRLIISKPEEMKQHLRRMKEAKAEAPSSPGPFWEQFAVTSAAAPTGPAMEEPVESVVDRGRAAPVEVKPIEPAPIEPAPAKAKIAGGKSAGKEELAATPAIETDTWKKRVGARSWLTNLLLGDPVDPRASREMVPGLIAYYFTGGNPVAQEVRDISATGIYIVTNERWYPGTVVRVTLTDRDHPTADRTLTVNAKAIRWGKDGVGLELVLEKEDQKATAIAETLERTLGVDPARVEAFLENLKTPPSQE
jgi:PilZ domain-containing protein